MFIAPLVVPGADLQAVFTTMTLCFVVVGTALYFFTVALSTVQLYYPRDVLGSTQLYSAMALIQLALTFGLAGFIPKIVRCFGKRNAYMGGAGFVIVGGATIFLAPAGAVAVGFSGLVIAYVGIMLVNMLVWALEPDTVEYGEWKAGVCTEGITYALFDSRHAEIVAAIAERREATGSAEPITPDLSTASFSVDRGPTPPTPAK